MESDLSALFQVDQCVLKIMSKPMKGRSYEYKDDVTELLRFIRNMDEHPNRRYMFTSLPLPPLHHREQLGICKCQ